MFGEEAGVDLGGGLGRTQDARGDNVLWEPGKRGRALRCASRVGLDALDGHERYEAHTGGPLHIVVAPPLIISLTSVSTSLYPHFSFPPISLASLACRS